MSALSAREGKDSEVPSGKNSRISHSRVENIDSPDAIEHPSAGPASSF
jgi:hypothetical protein